MNIRFISRSLRFSLGLVLASSLALVQVTSASAAQTCFVKAGALGTGTSWANAYGNPQAALANGACTEIWVAKGTYKPTSNADRTISFILKTGVALYGGFAGAETLRTQHNPAVNPTILSGNIGLAGNTDNSYHVVTGTGTNSTAQLDGFTIMAGYADGTSPSDRGGGMYNENGNPTLVNVNFSGNFAQYGGGIYNIGSSPTLSSVSFSGDSANAGGGMFNNSSNPVLSSVTFSANSANWGGGLYNIDSSPSLTNVTLQGNTVVWTGGGIYNSTSSPSLTNVTFSGNSAQDKGGGVYSENSSNPIITNSVLYGDAGGEIINLSSTPNVSFSIVQGGFPGTGNLNTNPLLKPLGNYGGSTKTMPLSYGSPAIDHGTNTGCPATDQRGILRPQDGDRNGTTTCDMGATESRLFIKSFQSLAVQDGWVLESSETSSIGGSSMNSTDPTLIVGDSTLRQQGRSILSFNTSSLPDTVQLVSVVLKVRQAQISATSPFSVLGNLLVDVRKGPFSNNAALQASDFQAPASKNAAITILNNPINGWYSRAVAAANLVYINKAGLTQFRLRFTLDDNNDSVSNFIRFYSGNAATLSVRPVLIVKYYLP